MYKKHENRRVKLLVEFTVPGRPVPQGRTRASIRRGKIHMRDPEESRNYKQYVGMVARQSEPVKPYEEALDVRMKIYRQIHKTMTKQQRKLSITDNNRQ